MKKIFALALAALSTVSMFAAINSQLTIYLDTDSKEVEARIAAGDTYSPFDAGACATYMPMYSNPSNIGMYVQYAGGDFMELNAPELVNVPLVIVTSREAAANQNYELFAEVGANHSVAVYVTDMRPDNGGDPVTFELNDLTDYSFSLANEAAFVEGENSVIADRFIINFAPYFVKTNAYGYASYSNNVDLVAPAGLTIYAGAIAGEVLNLNAVDYIAANEGVIVKGEANKTYVLSLGAGSSSFAGNDLKPASAWENHTGTIFVLSGEALYQYTGADFPANKAYLEIPVSSNGAPRRISFRFNGTTALENAEINDAKAVKFVENGQVFIRRGNEVFNLQGQIVK